MTKQEAQEISELLAEQNRIKNRLDELDSVVFDAIEAKFDWENQLQILEFGIMHLTEK